MAGGNSALVNSHLEGIPVRVIRRVGSGTLYRYDGLFYVDRYWPERPPSHGHIVWRYRLLKATDGGEAVVAPPPTPPGVPDRVPTTVQRIVRNTIVAQEVKKAHGDRCQVCGARLELPEGKTYSEAAHVQPLGLPHNGPDIAENILCLCPTDHVRFDHGAIYVNAGVK
jgi:putative restriction endonuclease